jgi:anti-anti-sigma factor
MMPPVSVKSGLRITESTVDQVLVLHLAGYLDGHTFADLERRISALLGAGQVRFVLDLAGLTYIASAGVGCFINARHLAGSKGGAVELVNPSPSVREIFSILGLEALFTIHDTVEQGVRAAKGA